MGAIEPQAMAKLLSDRPAHAKAMETVEYIVHVYFLYGKSSSFLV